MSIIIVLDMLALLALIVTVVLLSTGTRRFLTPDQIFILEGILGLQLIRDVSNLLEWSGLYPVVGMFEDYPGILEPLCWAILFYSFVQHRILRQLKEEEEKYRFITSSMSDVLWSASLDGKFTFMSPSVERYQGFTVEEVMSMGSFDLLTNESRRVAMATLARELAQDSLPEVDPDRNVIVELEQMCKDGSTVWSEISVSFLRDDQGIPIGYSGVTRDITQRIKDAAEREQLEAQLRQTQKLEAIGMLAGGIAHDFNNILFGILGFSDLALDSLKDEDEAAGYVKEIRSAGKRASSLVRQILTFARRTDRKLANIDVVPILEEVTKLMRSVLPAGITVKIDLKVDACMIYADPTEIHQVLLNLCTNASHAMQENGGTLEIKTWNTYLPADTQCGEQVKDMAPGQYLVISVRDTGKGIPQELLKKIFDPFFTTKAKGEGTGMGLATVRSIVEQLKGFITVDSIPNTGSEFRIHLPVSTDQTENLADQQFALPQGTESIIVVDDEPTLATMLTLILESLGYRVTKHVDSRDALASLRANPQKYDLVITDHAMPGMTGRELAKEIEQVRNDLPIIVCTGYSPSLPVQQDFTKEENSIAACAIKPITTPELAVLVREVLDRRNGV